MEYTRSHKNKFCARCGNILTWFPTDEDLLNNIICFSIGLFLGATIIKKTN